ncbi:MAG: N-acetylmuramoyl-L-alanine amidase [Candidatus Sumerlaeaceae bacterium]|nr:N-acetylmuramoyl-L-alanine amidase [Candidatus Sumerlaeaceae bacterium]
MMKGRLTLWAFVRVCSSVALGAMMLFSHAYGEDSASKLTLTILDPEKAATTTTREAVNVLGRTLPAAKVTVDGQPARVFATGIFVRDQVPLALGSNRIEIVAEHGNERAVETISVERLARKDESTPTTAPQRLQLEARTVEPQGEIILSPGDEMVVAVNGTPGQIAEYRVGEGRWVGMVEETDGTSTAPTGRYRGVFVAPGGSERSELALQFRLRANPKSPVRIVGVRQATLTPKTKITLWDGTKVRLARTRADGVGLVHGLHEVRLGGPYLAVLPKDVVVRVTGKRQGYWHIALTPTFDAWASAQDLELLPVGTPPPHLFFTLVSVWGDDLSDVVTIPYPRSARVPFSMTPSLGPAGRAQLCVDFYGAHHAATWISHRPSAKAIREVRVEQPAREHVRVNIELNSPQLWGYLTEVTTGSLVVRVRRAPQLVEAPESPLKGLTIALEAGHGGPKNTGARGVSGSMEKDINRMAVDELARQLREKGAEVVEARPGDSNPDLSTRARRVTESSATLFISIHANSADQSRGYLRVSGTSTYYKHGFCRDLSDAIHKRLLEMTKMDDFGNVGNFNYLPIREVTWMPSMLVEQAFMSNPEDEAKMLDPEFRSTMMKAVVTGIEDWLSAQRELQKQQNK